MRRVSAFAVFSTLVMVLTSLGPVAAEGATHLSDKRHDMDDDSPWEASEVADQPERDTTRATGDRDTVYRAPVEVPIPLPNATITQRWDNESLSPSRVDFGPNIGDVVTRFEENYGRFAFYRSAPGLLYSGDREAWSVFTVRYENRILWPDSAGARFLRIAENEVVTRHDVYAPFNSTPIGSFETTYQFLKQMNKISATFVPSSPDLPPTLYQVVWVTFTRFDSYSSNGVTLPFDPASLRLILTTESRIKVLDGNRHVTLIFEDAAEILATIEAGSLEFHSVRQNAVLVTFLPGELTIDPSVISGAVGPSATKYSPQRKTFFDGERYWAFWDGGSDSLGYAWSVDGRPGTWTISSKSALTGLSGLDGFSVAYYAGTVAVGWLKWSPGDPSPLFKLLTGILQGGTIDWDPTKEYPTNAPAPGYYPLLPSVVFTGQGTLVFTYGYVQTWIHVHVNWFTCTSQGASPCATVSRTEQVVSFTGLQSELTFYPVPFLGDDNSVGLMAVGLNSIGTAYAVLRVLGPLAGICERVLINVQDPQFPLTTNVEDITAAAPALNGTIAAFWFDNTVGQILSATVRRDCTWDAVPAAIWTGTATPLYWSAATEADGKTVDLVFTVAESGSTRKIKTIRTQPGVFAEDASTPGWLDTELNATHLSVAAVASRHVSMLYTIGTSLKLATVPVPAATPAIFAPGSRRAESSEFGSTVDPATGLLHFGMPLVGMPGRAGANAYLSLIYREPDLFRRVGSVDTPFVQAAPPWRYGVILDSISLDLPWINVSDNVLYLPGGRLHSVAWGAFYTIGLPNPGRLRWFNNTAGERFTLQYDNRSTYPYKLTLPSGSSYRFDVDGLVRDMTMPGGVNIVTYGYAQAVLNSITDPLGRSIAIAVGGSSRITSVTYGPQKYTFSYVCSPICTELALTDSAGRRTKLVTLDGHRLSRVEFPTGGKLEFSYALWGGNPPPIFHGVDTYTLPIVQKTVYNETADGRQVRTTVYNYKVQNDDIIFTEAEVHDNGVYRGGREYRYRPNVGMTSTRIVQPDTFPLRPNGAGIARWAPVGCVVNWDCTDEAVPDEDLSYVKATAPGDEDYYAIEDVGERGISSASTTVSKVDMTVRARVTQGTTSLFLQLMIGGVPYPPTCVVLITTTTYADVPCSWTTNPATGQPFTTTDLKDMLVGFSNSPISGGPETRVTQAYLTVSLKSPQLSMTRSFYSIDNQPHFQEGFAGDEAFSSTFSEELVDDWGNPVYVRDTTGQEVFGSFANTRYQNRFYAPGILNRTARGAVWVEGFDDYRHDFTIVTGSPALTVDDAQFDRYLPSLGIATTGPATVERKFGATSSPVLVELNARPTSTAAAKEILIRNSATTTRGGVRFASGGSMQYVNAGVWSSCPETYIANRWYRITMLTTSSVVNTYRIFRDGVEICGAWAKNLVAALDFGAVQLSTTAADAWHVDDVKISNGEKVTISGLKIGARVYLLTAEGKLVDQVRVATPGSVNLSLWPASSQVFFESGAAILRAASVDGVFEYVSPYKHIYGGDLFAYLPPRTMNDGLIRTKSGFGRWAQMIIDDSAPGGVVEGSWNWGGFQPVSGSLVHENVITGAPSTVVSHGWYSNTTGYSFGLTDYHVQYAYFRNNYLGVGSQAPSEILLEFRSANDSNAWKSAYWGVNAAPLQVTNIAQGTIPPVREGWIQLLVKTSDIGNGGDSVNGFRFKTVGGQALWDATLRADSSAGTLRVIGVTPNTDCGVLRFAGNGTEIHSMTANGFGEIEFDLYSNNKARLRAFPVEVRVDLKACLATTLFYTSPTLSIFGGDVYRYLGSLGFQTALSDRPGTDIHSAILGAKSFASDCRDAGLCLDMETVGADSAVTMGTGAVDTLIADLSGNSNHGLLKETTLSMAPGSSAAGFSLGFDGVVAHVEVPSSASTSSSSAISVSLWFKHSYLSFPLSDMKGLVWKGANTGLGQNNYALTLMADGRVRMSWHGSSSSDYVESLSAYTDNNVHHLVGVFDWAQDKFDLYIDGTRDPNSKTSSINAATNSGKLVFGKVSETSAPLRYFQGNIDQVTIYDERAINQNEAYGLFTSRMPGVKTLFAKYDLQGRMTQQRQLYERDALISNFWYDAFGNLVREEEPRVGGFGNSTKYAYSTFYSGGLLSKIIRVDGQESMYSYDLASGLVLSTLSHDCLRSRREYDSGNRPTRTLLYGRDVLDAQGFFAALKLHFDMETPDTDSVLLDGTSYMADLACRGSKYSNNGNRGTLTATTEVAGAQGKARYFNGVSSKIDAGNHGSLSLTSSFTLAAWVNLDDTATTKTILSKLSGASGYRFRIGSGGFLEADIGDGSALSLISSSGTISSGRLRHVAVVFDDTANTVAFYIDGEPVAETPSSYASVPAANSASLVVGQDNSGNYPMKGALDEVYVLNRAAAPAEIRDMFRLRFLLLAESQTAFDDMTSHGSAFFGYQFHSITEYDAVSIPRRMFVDMETVKATIGPTTYLEDASGSGNHLRNSGAIQLAAASCQVGMCYEFSSAESDHMEVPSTPSLNLTREITLAAWVRLAGPSPPPYNPIVAKGKSTFEFQYYADVRNVGGSYFFDAQLSAASGLSVGLDSTVAIPQDTWTHVAFTWDGYTLRLYVNGLASGSAVFNGGPLRTTTWPLRFGNYLGTSNYLNGRIDEVHIIDRALSSTELLSLKQATETSHLTRSHFDGIGRPIRSSFMDLFGRKITSARDLRWNDQTASLYPPATPSEVGKMYTYFYDLTGRTLASTAPGDGVVSTVVYNDSQRNVEAIDAIGRRSSTRADLLGRIVEAAIWNLSSSTYDNRTSYTYSLAGVTTATDPKGQMMRSWYSVAGSLRVSLYPDGSRAAVFYDDNLREVRTVDVAGRIATTAYDILSRPTSMTLKPPDESQSYVVSFYYDSVSDNLEVVANGTANIIRTFDVRRRLEQEFVDVKADSGASEFVGSLVYSYDAASRMTAVRYPTGLSAEYIYDSLGRVSEVRYGGTKYANLSYDAAGRVTDIWYWNGTTDTNLREHYDYDLRDRLAVLKVHVVGPSPVTYMKLDFSSGYNKASDLVGYTDDMFTGGGGASDPKAVTYAYDGNGWLWRATGPWGAGGTSQTLTYTYDRAGNIQSKRVDTTTTTYGYGPAPAWNRLDSLSGGIAATLGYNTAGSVTSWTEGSATSYTYDFTERLVKAVKGANTYRFWYDGVGRRVKSDDAGTATYFIHSENRLMYARTGSTDTVFAYLGEKIILRKTGSEAVRFYHQDQSNSVRLVTYYMASMNVGGRWRYKPFGEKVDISGTDNPRLRYAGEWLDANVGPSSEGLYYMGARYQEPRVGRFPSRDPIGSGYDYASNNPIAQYDPSGLKAERPARVDPAWSYTCIANARGGCSPGLTNPEFLPENSCDGLCEFVVTLVLSFVCPPCALLLDVAYTLDAAGRGDWLGVGLGIALPLLGGAGPALGRAYRGYRAVRAADHLAESRGAVYVSRELRTASWSSSRFASLRYDEWGHVGFVRRAVDDVDPGVPLARPLKEHYRENLIRWSGVDPGEAFDAHHVFPKTFEGKFQKIKFKGDMSIHHPKHLTWWDSIEHQKYSKAIEREWRRFFTSPDVTVDDAFDLARDQARRYGF